MSDTKAELCSLWENQTRDGMKYLSGPFGKSKILVFPNKYKKTDKHPDYIAYIVPRDKRESGDNQPTEQDGVTDEERPF